jgi:hypothetical protein
LSLRASGPSQPVSSCIRSMSSPYHIGRPSRRRDAFLI